ncbi:DUF2312 domain-containing protein [uncultured Roseobacter sp.]|uniref:DUF2312 domain-containing protein n=1 Tax=uncultured Roseobacter sp. TaxID=114847 RepID=UPI002625BC29|nr:DUF2312 domain-containing protein [uncultured Roseobacter sp.]
MSDQSVVDSQYNVTGQELRQFIERVERLEEEKKDIADQVKEVFAEMKSRGFDVKAIRVILRERKQDPDSIAEQTAIVDMYKSALGME